MTPPRLTTSATLASLAYLAHAAELLAFYTPSDLLWSCNIACLAICTGLWLSSPHLNAAGTLLLTVGNVIWILDLTAGGELLYTAPLTHIGVYALGLHALRHLSLPPGAWWRALGLLGLALASARIAGPPHANVNLAFHMPPGWSAIGLPRDAVPAALEPIADSHPVFILYLATVFTLSALAQQALLPRLLRIPPGR